MFLKKVSFKNFRCFQELELELPPNEIVLIGKNGSGKTSFLQGVLYGLVEFVQPFVGMLDDMPRQFNLSEEAWREVSEREYGFVATPQYPVELKFDFLISEKEYHVCCTTDSRKDAILNPDASLLQRLAFQWKSQAEQWDDALVLPVIACFGTTRQWNFPSGQSNARRSANGIPRSNGYRGSLNATADVNGIRDWFQKMLLMERRRPERAFEFVRFAMAKVLEVLFNSDQKEARVVVDYDAEIEDIDVRITQGKQVELMPLFRMSDGVKSVLSMVADIAYRMAILNPQLESSVLLETPGIVIIDEVDMHLHPAWQKSIVPCFSAIFPKVQFIFTTHAPAVLANVQTGNILKIADGSIYPLKNNKPYGKAVDAILRDTMETQVRPQQILELLGKFHKNIDDSDLDAAQKTLGMLKKLLGENDEDVIRAQITLDLENMEIREEAKDAVHP